MHLFELDCNRTQLQNHSDWSSCIGNKKGLFHYLGLYCSILNEDINSIIPQTLHLPQKQLQEITRQTVLPDLFEGPWIVKPGESTNRGTGITIQLDKVSLMSELMKRKEEDHSCIIQKYIKPFLYHGRKFDIRIWVVWSGRKLWWYR
jgi:hypothetical protein